MPRRHIRYTSPAPLYLALLLGLLVLLFGCRETNTYFTNDCELAKIQCARCEKLDAPGCEDCPSLVTAACEPEEPPCDRRGQGHCREAAPSDPDRTDVAERTGVVLDDGAPF